jgi:outer membrane protein assembly factor BamB
VNALDARDGSVAWSRNAALDTGAETPYWGFSASPLVVHDVVIVAASGTLVGYELGTGEPSWVGADGGESYSSPQSMLKDGVEQVLQVSKAGVASVAPADGTVLWEHLWPGASAGPGGPIVQPALTPDGDVLISLSAGGGTRRLHVTHATGAWSVQERWTTLDLKPFFNDSVIHEGHAYGFDGNILACIDLQDGRRQWKGGRYGAGQLVLLPDQDLLLVLGEKGELALVRADPDQFTEVARSPALVGKTWNHPVLVGDLLLVRNAREMAAFRLQLGSS